MKLKWKVSPPPTGRHRSFETRGWPTAYFQNGDPAAAIYCKDDYEPSLVKTGQHAELVVWVAKWHRQEGGGRSFKWKTLVRRANTLDAAKQLATEFFRQHPEFYGPEEA
jgi:hypothetical protein